MKSIFIKELNSYFSSIVGYVAIMLFLIFCGVILWIMPDNIMDNGYANMDYFFNIASWAMVFLIPAITMRCFPDEFRGGTIEWLSTKPLTALDIILGKYFASLVLVVFALIPTLIYVYSIDNLSVVENNLDTGGIIGSYIGLFFTVSAFTAIGVFCSSLTSNQIVGFLLAVFANTWFYWGFEGLSMIPQFTGGVDYYLNLVGMSHHYKAISKGFLDSRDVIYFLSIIILFIALTRLSLDRRTWDTAQQS